MSLARMKSVPNSEASFSSTLMAKFAQPELGLCIPIHMQNTQSQSTVLWHRDYFKLIIFEKLQTQEKLWKQSRSYSFIREV